MKKIILSAFILILLVYFLPFGFTLSEEREDNPAKEHTVSRVEKSSSSQEKFEQIASKEVKSSENSSDVSEQQENTAEAPIQIAVSVGGAVRGMDLADINSLMGKIDPIKAEKIKKTMTENG